MDDVRVCTDCGAVDGDADGLCLACGAPLGVPPPAPAEARRVVTILFTDVTGSTAMGEQLDPESLRRVMSRYFTEMTAVLHRHGATIEKYIGDAVMAVFGQPVAHEDDALRAVRAAVEMRDALDQLNAELVNAWGVTIQTRTGLNTGEVLANNVVVDGQSLVVGDAVNVAARLEQAAEPGEILIGDATFRLVRDAVIAEPVGPLPLKGKTNPVRAWKVVEVHRTLSGWNRRLDSPLVTRDAELGRLHDVLQRMVQTSTCQVMTVMGGAGIGKSRLVSEFLAQVAGDEWAALGRCQPYGEGSTFRPIVEILKQLVGSSLSDSPQTAVGNLDVLLGAAPDAIMVSDRIRSLLGIDGTPTNIQETFWALRRLLQHLASTQPVVLVFDDIQWAEPTLLDLLEYLTDWLGDARVLMVCLSRPELMDERPGWLEGRPNADLLKLEPLPPQGVDLLIANLVQGAELPHEAQTCITELAEGNPLFVEETLRMLVDDTVLRLVDGSWTVVGDLSRAAIPPTIHALIAARLDRLEPEERAVIERGSVAGRQFWWGAIWELSPPELRGSVAGSLQSLSRKQLIRPGHSDFAGEDAFEFQHILIRDTAYAEMPKETRADLHERLAEWIARKTGDGVIDHEELVGFHLERSYRTRRELGPLTPRARHQGRRAATLLSSVGRNAYARGDMPAAVNLLSRADALLSSDDVQRLDILPSLAFALMEVGQFERLVAVATETHDLASASGDPGRLAHANILNLYIRLFTSPETWAEEAEREARNALATFQRLGDDSGLARGWSLFGLVNVTKAQFASAQQAWEKAAEHAGAAGDRRSELEALSWVLLSLWAGPAPVEQGLRRSLSVLERAGGDQKARATAMFMRAVFEAARGDDATAKQLIEQARSLLEEIALTVWMAGPLAQMAGLVELRAQRPDAAEQELRRGYDTLIKVGEMAWTPTVAALLAQAVYAQERFDEAQSLADRSRELAGSEDVFSQVLWRRVSAALLARRGQGQDAETLIREALDVAALTDSLPLQGEALLGLAEVLALCSRSAESAGAIQDAVQVFERKGDVQAARTSAELLAKPSL
ncbi:MAG: adenylate/guanylate cyclase domain-containing protein [Pseudonocardiales bacterium]